MNAEHFGRICHDCGRNLETGEICDCRRGTWLPKDGLRARCARFRHRSSYRGKAYIVCAAGKMRFDTAQMRDAYYEHYCCGVCGECEKCER